MRDPWKRPENQNLMGKDCRATATIPVGSGQLPCTIAKRRAKWPSLVHRLTWFGILAAGVGCQSRQPLPQAAAKTQTVSPPTCTASQATPDGTCCPTGQFWLAGSLSCSSVGPPECATGVWSSPQACWPPWCQVGGSATCGSDGVGCGFSGDVCTPDQVGSGLACPAGALRSGARLCVAAGSFAGSGIDPSAVGEGALAALPADVSSTLGADLQVHPVPAIDQAFLCGSGGGEPYFCTSGEQAAPNSPSTSPAAPDLGCRSRNKELFCQWRTRVRRWQKSDAVTPSCAQSGGSRARRLLACFVGREHAPGASRRSDLVWQFSPVRPELVSALKSNPDEICSASAACFVGHGLASAASRRSSFVREFIESRRQLVEAVGPSAVSAAASGWATPSRAYR